MNLKLLNTYLMFRFLLLLCYSPKARISLISYLKNYYSTLFDIPFKIVICK